MITENILRKIFPGCKNAAQFVLPINAMSDHYSLHPVMRIVMFLAQTGHESAEYTQLVENLNYSAEALMRTWPRRFPSIERAREFERKPEMIANEVYGGRMGNGPAASGDGWKFRGRGLVQVTGRSSYQALAIALGLDLADVPAHLETPRGAVWSAGWYWGSNSLNFYADSGDIIGCTRKINGGLNGLADRQEIYKRAMSAIKGEI